MLTLFNCQSLFQKTSVLIGFVLWILSAYAFANSPQTLAPIPPQSVFVGKAFTYQVRATVGIDAAYAIRMLNAPNGAVLDRNPDGSYTFRWVPAFDVPLETVVILQAVDAQDSGLVSTQRMLLRRENSNTEPQLSLDELGTPSLKNITETEPEPLIESLPDLTVGRSPPELPNIGIQSLLIDQDYQLIIKPISDDGALIELIASALPSGAVLEEVLGGSHALRWRPRVDQVGVYRVGFVATDGQDASLTSEQIVIFDVSINGETNLSLVDDLAEDSIAGVENVALEPVVDEAYFEPLSGLIVSVGSIINFKVVPHMPDRSEPILHVDRLPANASFADNYDGTRTFYWQTTNADQGAHTFRFTAIHHSNVNQRVSTEVLMIIGDPAASNSSPTTDSAKKSGSAKIESLPVKTNG